MQGETPLKILHSFASLGRGGIETWLMNILRLKRKDIQFDFILTTKGGEYEEEARSYGCQIHYAPPIRQLRNNLSFLAEVLVSNQYDVFHAHGEEFLGDAIKVAFRAGVPVRVAHCHGTALARGKKSLEMTLRSLRFLTLDRSRILKYATDIVACSGDAGRFLVGKNWDKDRRCFPLYCGVPLDQFHSAVKKTSNSEFRKLNGIPEDAIVVGHAGSMGPSPVKNHLFLVEIFQELVKRDRRYFLFMAGDGPLRQDIEKAVCAAGFKDRVLMPGTFRNVPELMMYGFDVHLLPSLHEGLPVVGIESVAAGLYTVCSDTITPDFTTFFANRITTVSLASSPYFWAGCVDDSVTKKISAQEGCTLVEKSPFSINASVQNLISMYCGSRVIS